jgi:hypothetical protein
MYRLRQRLMQPQRLSLVALSSVAFAVLLALFALTAQIGAAQPAKPGDAITFAFTVTVKAGTPPSDVLFWFCPDAQNDGTGCDEMNAQPDGTFTYQFATTTGTTYQHITIEWSHGRLPSDKGPIPVPPAHITCDYHPFNVTSTNPRSFTCYADFTPSTVTPVPSVTPIVPPPAVATTPTSATGGDNATLVTGLQIVIGVGIFLFVLLLAILVWQRVSRR